MNTVGKFLLILGIAPSLAAIDMIPVPSGSFNMGANGMAPVHQVTLTQPFSMSRTEITNAEFLPVLQWAYENGHATVAGSWVQGYGQNLLRLDVSPYDFTEIRFDSQGEVFYLTDGTGTYGSWGPGGGYVPDNRPANYLTWYGAAAFCDWLSMMNNLTPFYQGNWSNSPSHNPYLAEGYRLPTEAEWEYAASYNGNRDYPWGNSSPACSRANIRPGSYCVGWSRNVGSYPSGASFLGFLDMAGNINEWVNDWYASYSTGNQTNPMGPENGSQKILRGGSWTARTSDNEMHTARRRSEPPTATTGTPWFAGSFGFRIAIKGELQTSDTVELPEVFRLYSPYPNPFNPSTTIRLNMERTDEVALSVYDLQGRLVERLHQGLLARGEHGFLFEGGHLASGLYFVNLEGAAGSLTQKVLLAK